MTRKTTVARRKQRGVVLITVILVLLVLTVLGLTAAIMMTQEDRSSSRAEMQREAFYVAEAGLRRAEGIAATINYDNVVLSTMLARPTTTACPATNPQVPVVPTVSPTRDWGVGHLGTYMTDGAATPTELANQDVTAALNLSGKVKAFYSLYVRNNEGEASATINTDTKIRIISVGWVADPNNNPLAVKILEEEIDYAKLSMNVSTQKQVDFGGTGSGVFGG
jgi:Tfp pilus assembly protein PilX